MNPFDLVVPGLCGPLPDPDALQNNPTLSSLAGILARADKTQSVNKGFHSELSELFGLQSVPSAVLSLLGHGYELTEGHWFHADPVHLQADMDRAILRDSLSIDLNLDEADALVKEVNEHFSEDGIRLIALDANHWFLNIADNADIETTPLHDVIGCNVNFYLPKGKNERYWKRFLNEVQMLFHMSDVNKQREASGLFPVNSLWLWGEGELPASSNEIKYKVYADHSVVKGLADAHGSENYPVRDVELLCEAIRDDYLPLMVFDDVFIPACYGDVAAWQDALDVLFDQKIKPLVTYAMSRQRPVRLRPCNGVHYLISHTNKYRFLRKANIKDHVGSYE